MFAETRDLQPDKAEPPMLVRLFGNAIEVRLLKYSISYPLVLNNLKAKR